MKTWTDVRDSVLRLTETTKRFHRNGDQSGIYDAPPLIEELRRALMPSGEKSGGSVSVASGAPASLDALDLMVEIEQWIEDSYWEVRQIEQRPGFRGLTSTERLQYVAARVTESTLAGDLHGPGLIDVPRQDILEDAPKWVDRIERLFDPPKVVPIPDYACPICRHTRTSVQVEPGEFMETAALTVTLGHLVHARCGECGASWPPAEMVDFARVLGVDTEAMARLIAQCEYKRLS